VNIDDLVRDQTPVVVLVSLLDGTARKRIGVITSYDGVVMRMYDLLAAPGGDTKGFRSTPVTHVIRIEPIPCGSVAYDLVRELTAAAYTKGPQG
jgi:hypothetical protein